MSKKIVALLVALTLLLGITAGGTLAWLMDKTDEVKNTFTPSNIDITLEETKGEPPVDDPKTPEDESKLPGKSFPMVPGATIEKDPVVTVEAGSEACYVFVKLVKVGNVDEFLEYAVDTTVWTAVEGETDVYYALFETKVAADTKLPVLKDNIVKVKTSVDNEDMEALKDGGYPALTFTAYAAQLLKETGTNHTVAEAWAIAKAQQ